MPGVLTFNATLAAGASVTNVLSGTILERLGARPELIAVFAVQNTTNSSPLFKTDLRLGNVVVVDAAPIPTYTDSLGPDRDKHLIARAVGTPFDLIQLKLTNGSAATVTYRILVEAISM